ncbi:MAG TPA: hypothetical protein VFD82_24665 [Planctomycetota bacterium]|nr:hypothetical protein [Planctomycetota bacterium]
MTQDPPSPDRPPVARLAGELGAALVAAGLCYGLSCLIVAPSPEAITFGKQWEWMSEAPFELRGQFPHRILGPLLAHCLGLGGACWVPFVRGLAVLLLATVFFFARCRGARPVDALLVTLAMAVTAPIQMYKQHWVGFVDPLCYLLFFWAWMAAGRPVLYWGLFLANLLSHELAAFLLPWAWFVRREANGCMRADVIGAGLALGLYGAFYLWVKAAAPQQKFTASYFFDNPMFPGGTVVTITLAITHLVVAFGPILAVLAWHQHTRRDRERAHLWLVGGGIIAIFCIAWDWSRHSNLIALPLVLASLHFVAAGHRLVYTGIVGLGVGLMVWIPPWFISAWPTSAIADGNLLMATRAGLQNPATKEPMGGALSDVLTAWVPAVAPVVVPILAILAAIWFAGAWFARRQASATAGPAA